MRQSDSTADASRACSDIRFDGIGVDGRYNTDAVHKWVARNHHLGAKVLVGDPGWTKPLIARTEQKEVGKTGKKKKATKKTATREPARRQEATADIDVLLLSDEE